jgi:hypothetical protein|tara:strand:- start:10394 stop:10540 length:147 start_codon:yes stop_codon:yes gene_type:complete
MAKVLAEKNNRKWKYILLYSDGASVFADSLPELLKDMLREAWLSWKKR